MQTAARQRIGERRDDVLLAHELGECLGAPFTRENLVAHSNETIGRFAKVLFDVRSELPIEEQKWASALSFEAARSEARDSTEDVQRGPSEDTTKQSGRAAAFANRGGEPFPRHLLHSLWLLPSGPDQIHDFAMRGDPPYTQHYTCAYRLRRRLPMTFA